MPFRQLKSFLKILIGVQYKHTEKAVRFAPRKPVDCPSEAVGNGDRNRLGSRRARENSQRAAFLQCCEKLSTDSRHIP